MQQTEVIRIVPTFDFGGVESIVVAWSEAMVRHPAFTPRVCTFWADGSAARSARALGVHVDVLDVDPKITNPAATVAAASYIRQYVGQNSIIHSSISEANFHVGLAHRLMRSRSPLIIEETGVPDRSLVGRLTFMIAYRHATHIIAVAENVADYLQRRESQNPDRISVIYNALPPSAFTAHEAPPRTGPLRVVYIGRLVAVKNLYTLLQAFRRVVDSIGNVTLDIVGDGPLWASLHQACEDLGLRRHVHFHGHSDDVRTFLYNADLFVLPSYSEGLSVALLEACAAGTPALASDVPGNREALGLVGALGDLLVPPEEVGTWAVEMSRLLRMPSTARRELGRQLRNRVLNTFGPRRHIEQLTSLYKCVSQTPPQRT